VLAGVLAVAALIFIVGDPPMLFPDFRTAYYAAGAAVLHGASLAPVISHGVWGFVWGFVNLPVVAYVFAPFAILPVKPAALVFAAFGVGAIVLAYRFLVDLAGIRGQRRIWLMLAMAANGPLIYSLKLGNASHIVLAMLAGALCLLRTKRQAAAGALLAAAALIKLPLLLFGLYFLARRNWRATAGFSAVLLVTGGLSLVIFGLPLHVLWYDVVVRTASSHALAAFNVQSIQSLLLRFHEPPPPLADWRLYRPDLMARVIAAAIVAALFAAMIWAMFRPISDAPRGQDAAAPRRLDLEFMLVLCLAVLSTPLAWTHYYCWFLLPAAFAIGGRLTEQRRPGVTWASIVALLLVTPLVTLPSIANPVFAQVYERFLVSTYFAGGLLWFVILLRCRLAAAAPSPVLAQGSQAAGP
jgi:hypothetical protein